MYGLVRHRRRHACREGAAATSAPVGLVPEGGTRNVRRSHREE